ncbi:MAG: MFS transporter [Pseudomonadota bacterium]
MQPDYLDSNYSWFRLVISVLAGTVMSVGMWATVLVLPAVQEEFGISRADASIAFTAAMIGFGFGNMWLGRVVDRFGIVPVLLGAGIVLAASFGLSALVKSMWMFAALQLFIGISAAAGFGPLIADLSHWFLRRRGIAVASAACGNYLAGAIWPLVLKGIIDTQGWRTAFIVIATSSIVMIIPLALMLRRRPPQDASIVSATGNGSSFNTIDIGLSPRMLQVLLCIAAIACCVAMAMPQVHIVAYCSDLGYGVTVGAEMLSLMLAGGIVSRLASGFIADYIGGVRTLLIGSILQCLALFLYMPFDGLMSLYVVSLVFGLAQGGIVPSYAIIVREYLPAKEAGRQVGIVVMASVMGMALGGWLSGLIYDLTGSYQAAFLNGIAWNFLNIAIMVMLLLRGRARQVAAA